MKRWCFWAYLAVALVIDLVTGKLEPPVPRPPARAPRHRDVRAYGPN